VRSRAWCAVLMVLLTLPWRTAGAAALEPVFATATGEIDAPGTLTPIGDGRFATQDRIYAGRMIGRSVVDDWSGCFSGTFSSSEEWALEAPKMAGSHLSSLTIRSERGSVTLQLRGQMEFPSASGGWEIVRATGNCAGLAGDGRYTATFSSVSPEFRLTLDGQLRK
jgi:hypothetical protein